MRKLLFLVAVAEQCGDRVFFLRFVFLFVFHKKKLYIKHSPILFTWSILFQQIKKYGFSLVALFFFFVENYYSQIK